MDPFALFGLEAAPGLDEAALKERFARMTAESHPDKFQNAGDTEKAEVETRYAELNRAYQTLAEPRARLLALYELSQGAKPRDVQRIPPGTMDLFIEVGKICRTADEFLEKRGEASGALARAALMEEEMSLQEAMQALAGRLAALGETLGAELAALDAAWRGGKKDATALEALYRKFSYLGRWRQQLEEREIALLTGE
jgi:curved DNA-binding protein CbpA